MTIIKIGLISLLIVMVILALTGRKTFYVKTFIPAEPEQVWKALLDESAYKKWNTVLVPIEGEKIELGKKIKYTMTDQNGVKSVISIDVNKMHAHKELNQKGGVPFILTFDHKYLLKEVEGGTLLIQHEVDKGLWMWFWDSSWIENAYGQTAKNLRNEIINNRIQ